MKCRNKRRGSRCGNPTETCLGARPSSSIRLLQVKRSMVPSDNFLVTACCNSGVTITELNTFSFLQNLTTTQLVRIFPVFKTSQNSLPFSQHPITEPYMETNSLSLRSTLKSSHLCQRLVSYLFPSCFLPKSFIQPSATKRFLPNSYFFIFSPSRYIQSSTDEDRSSS